LNALFFSKASLETFRWFRVASAMHYVGKEHFLQSTERSSVGGFCVSVLYG